MAGLAHDFSGVRGVPGRLERRGIAAAQDLKGCSEAELAAVRQAAGSFVLPEQYFEFLGLMGREAGRLFRGTDMFFPGLLECHDQAREFAEDDDPGLTVANRHFFGHHAGYQWYLFQRGTAEVFMYTEESGPPVAKGEDFLDFLWGTIGGRGAKEATGEKDPR